MTPFALAVTMIAWGLVLEFGSSEAVAAVASVIDHDFGREWPYVMMGAGAFLAAGAIRRRKCRWIYRAALVVSMMVWAAMSALMIDRGWYWAFATVAPCVLAVLSLILKVADSRQGDPLWRSSSLT